MLQVPFEVLGFFEEEIFFQMDEKVIVIKKRLPKEDLILKLKIEPEDIKPLRDEIFVQASKMPLTYSQRMEYLKQVVSQG